MPVNAIISFHEIKLCLGGGGRLVTVVSFQFQWQPLIFNEIAEWYETSVLPSDTLLSSFLWRVCFYVWYFQVPLHHISHCSMAAELLLRPEFSRNKYCNACCVESYKHGKLAENIWKTDELEDCSVLIAAIIYGYTVYVTELFICTKMGKAILRLLSEHSQDRAPDTSIALRGRGTNFLPTLSNWRAWI